MEFSGGWEARGSVFVLAQVSLFIEIILLWRCKTFLQVRQQKGNDGIMFLKQTELCGVSVDGWVHVRLPLLHRECPLSC